MKNAAGHDLKSEAPDTQKCSPRIPFHLGAELILKSLSNADQKSKTTVVGVVHGQIIMIDEPLFSMFERMSGSSEGFTCAYLSGNHLYKFRSRFKKRLYKNIVGIDYPDEAEVLKIRSSARTNVNLKADVLWSAENAPAPGDMIDISEGGCRLALSQACEVAKGDVLHLTFTLPDGQSIENLPCTVMNISHLQDQQLKLAGLSFSTADSQSALIKSFCRLCAYLKM